MTAKEYRKMCRIRVTRLAKLITFLSLLMFFGIAEYMALSGYMSAAIATTLWFYMPDIATYILEWLHRLKHDFVSYR